MKTFWASSVSSQAGAAPLEPIEMYMPTWDESIFSQLHSHSCVFKQRIRIFKQEVIHPILPYLHQWEVLLMGF